MFAPIFSICSKDSEVLSYLGDSPVRLFAFGDAPQNTQTPYAVWQTVSGLPSTFINEVPDIDSYVVQVDVYSDSMSEARDTAKAIRNAVEPHANITAWRGEFTDTTTLLRRYSFDITWFVNR